MCGRRLWCEIGKTRFAVSHALALARFCLQVLCHLELKSVNASVSHVLVRYEISIAATLKGRYSVLKNTLASDAGADQCRMTTRRSAAVVRPPIRATVSLCC